MTTLHLAVDRASSVSLTRQIYEGLRLAILEGRLRAGQRVPSTRALAEDLSVSRLTVLNAYEQLLHEGYLTGRIGSGTYVSQAVPDDLLSPTGAADVSRSRRNRSTAARSLRARDEGGLGPFRMSVPALDQFPHTTWARTVSRHAHALTHANMAYGDPAGLPALRAAIADHLRAARAVRCEADQVLIVSGSQAALRLAIAVLMDKGDRVAVEEPGYPLARVAIEAGGARTVPVSVDDEGLDVATLRRHGGRVRAAYVTPSHQYPLGTSMSVSRRFALIEWAHRRKAWILEDDYDSEYRYVSRPVGALQGMDAQSRVVYIGTFSKVLFPAIRIGYLVVPRSLEDRFVAAREALDLQSPTLYQLALEEFLREGHFARHLRHMRGVYLSRRNALLEGLTDHCASHLTIHNADAGLHITAFLRDGLSDVEVVRRMAERGLTATPLSSCYAGTVRQSGLLLGFGGSTERRLREAARTLGQVLGSTVQAVNQST